MDDMIAVFRVPAKDRAHFAAALTTHYTELTELASLKQLTDARAIEFFDKVRQIREALPS